jgi:hypothetical protein
VLQFLLDTNIIIYTIKNRPPGVRAFFEQHEGRMAVSSVTLGELVFGAERSSKPQANLAIVESLLARMDVLPFDDAGHDDRGPCTFSRPHSGDQQRPRVCEGFRFAHRELGTHTGRLSPGARLVGAEHSAQACTRYQRQSCSPTSLMNWPISACLMAR